MKTDHIRNIVLLAKYFYKHTGSIIADVQKALKLDGFDVSDDEVFDIMVKNYDI